MKRIYHRVKVNEALLKPSDLVIDDSTNPFKGFMSGRLNEVLPSGTLKGVYFQPYFSKEQKQNTGFPGEGGGEGGFSGGGTSSNTLPFVWGHTDIAIKDAKGRDVSELPTDIQDFYHKGGGYLDGFKKIDLESDSDTQISISWDTYGDKPICGEFIFYIEENCECNA